MLPMHKNVFLFLFVSSPWTLRSARVQSKWHHDGSSMLQYFRGSSRSSSDAKNAADISNMRDDALTVSRNHTYGEQHKANTENKSHATTVLRKSGKEAEGPKMRNYLLILVAGMLTGCSMLCCLAKIADREERIAKNRAESLTCEELEPSDSSLSAGVGTILRATRATMANIGRMVEPEHVETNLRRIVLMESMFLLDHELAKQFLESTPSPVIPVQVASDVSQLDFWRRISSALLEDEDGLHICVAHDDEELRHQLMSWSGSAGKCKQMEVQMLPRISVDMNVRTPQSHFLRKKPTDSDDSTGAEDQASPKGKTPQGVETDESPHARFRDRVSVEIIRGRTSSAVKDPTSLQAFVLRWDDGSVAVLGCEDEDLSEKWVKTLNMYSNIGQRFYSAFMWKLNADVASELTLDPEEAKDTLADVRNWRRRLCLLEFLHNQRALCISYMSEKDDDGRVGNILVSTDQGDIASVKPAMTVPVKSLPSWEEERIRVNVHQYNLSLLGDGCAGSVQETTVPKTLFGVEVRQRTSDYGGQEHSMYAFEDEDSRDEWLAVLQLASKSVKRDQA